MSPTVSVILPAYNASATIIRAIDSIIHQRFTDWELLVIDDGSTDDTRKLISCIQDERVKLIETSHGGIAVALNIGLGMARGKYIARMDADDICLPRRLEQQYQFLEAHKEVGLVSCLVTYHGNQRVNRGYYLYVKWINNLLNHEQMYLSRFVDSPVAHPSVMFRASLIKSFGLYDNNEGPEDYELWLRWFEEGILFTKLNEEGVIWTDHPNRLSRTDKRYNSGQFYRLKAEYFSKWYLRQQKHQGSVLIFGAGKVVRERVKWLNRYGVEIAGFIDVQPVDNREGATPPVYHYTHFPCHKFILSYVSDRKGRMLIHNYLTTERGLKEGEDFYMMA